MKDRPLRIEPVWKDGLPMCINECESRCLKPESVIGANGCYAWRKMAMGACPENPTVCKPYIAGLKDERDKLEESMRALLTNDGCYGSAYDAQEFRGARSRCVHVLSSIQHNVKHIHPEPTPQDNE